MEESTVDAYRRKKMRAREAMKPIEEGSLQEEAGSVVVANAQRKGLKWDTKKQAYVETGDGFEVDVERLKRSDTGYGAIAEREAKKKKLTVGQQFSGR